MTSVKYQWWLFLTIIFLSCTCSAIAQTTGSITGKVFSSGTALKGVIVGAYPNDDEKNYLKFAITDADGIYTLTGLPVRGCKVKYSLTGGLNYVGGWYKADSSPVAAFSDASVITLTNTSPSADIGTTSLVTGGQITGTITDVSDSTTGIAGVYVQAYSNGEWAKTSDLATDANGGYTIVGLREGDYTLKFWAYETDYATAWYSSSTATNTVPDETNASSVTIATAGAIKDGINAQLSTGGSISGTVWKTGTPNNTLVVGGQVRAYDSSSPFALRGFATTDEYGKYTITALPTTGTYFIKFYEKTGTGLTEWYDGPEGNGASAMDNAQEVVIADNKSTTGIDAVLDRGSISGTVTYTDKLPAGGLTIDIYANESTQPATPAASARTDAEGKYSTEPTLPAGTYKVQFQENVWYNNKTTFTEADAVKAGAINVNSSQIASPYGSISGTLTIRRGNSTEPVEGGFVQVYNSTDASVLAGTAITGIRGIYNVTGLPLNGGSFKVRFFRSTADGSGYGTSEWYDNQSNFGDATDVTVGDTVDAVLEPATLAPIYNVLLLKKR